MAFLGPPVPPARFGDQIRARSEEIRGMGVYLGFFEWLVWGETQQARVLMLFGSTIKDLKAVFGGQLAPFEPRAIHRVAAVDFSSGRMLSAVPEVGGDLPRVNHFVIGVASSGHAPPVGVGTQKRGESALRAALRAGWLLKETQARGDCALDTMAFLAGRPRCPETWQAIRDELADFMLWCADREEWLWAWGACQEDVDRAPPLAPLGSGGLGPSLVLASSDDEDAVPVVPPALRETAAPIVASEGFRTTPEESSRGLRLGGGSAVSVGFGPPVAASAAEASRSAESGLDASVAASRLVVASSLAEGAGAQTAAVPPQSFEAWVESLSPEALAQCTRSYFAFREAEERWLAALRASRGLVPRATPRKRRHDSSFVRHRLATGVAYLEWRGGPGAGSPAPLRDFLLRQRVYAGSVPKKDRVWLASCVAAAGSETRRRLSLAHHAGRSTRPSVAEARVPVRFLRRARGGQGPGYKCPLIRELLWDWFVDIRRSIHGSISPKFMLMKARSIADAVLQHGRVHGGLGPMPRIDRHWLLRFKRDKQIVFRKPNMRVKCSKEALHKRLRAMWRNVIVVRRLAQLTLGHDLAESMYGLDEKPIHFNESGSKNTRTLELAGAPSVMLKQNHSATRERVSVMTCVTSCPAAASQPSRLPLELLFRAKSNKRIRSLVSPADLRVSFQWALKGSYRLENMLAYLRRWLDPWTPEREAAGDYRILMLDVAKSHIDDAVIARAWDFGYVVLFHYGCTTGVAQVNDTDLHGEFERVFLEFEQASFLNKQFEDPGNITRRPAEVVEDACSTWRVLDHTQALRGHKRVGLSNALDGSEDHLICREALGCWTALGMSALRRELLAEVDAAVASGPLTFADWRTLVRHPDDAGVLRESGGEFEGDAEAGSAPWRTAAEEAERARDDEAWDGSAGSSDALVVRAQPGDPEADVSEALRASKRLAQLRELRARAETARVPGALFSADREARQLERGLRARDGRERQANAVLRRALEDAASQELLRVASARDAARLRAAEVRRERAKAAAKKKAAEAAKAARVAVRKAVAALPKAFTPAECSAPGAKGVAARKACLERLMLQSPKLPLRLEVNWPVYRDQYAALFPKVASGHVGSAFLDQVRKVIRRLGEHWSGATKTGDKGNPKAFEEFVEQMRKAVPVPAGTLEI